MTNWDLPYRAGLAQAMSMVRGKWHVAVLSSLTPGEIRFGDLLSAVNEVEQRVRRDPDQSLLTDRTLTDTLDRLLRAGLIVRRKTEGFPAESWYRLTPLGRSLLRALRPLAEWAQENQEQLIAVPARPSGSAR